MKWNNRVLTGCCGRRHVRAWEVRTVENKHGALVRHTGRCWLTLIVVGFIALSFTGNPSTTAAQRKRARRPAVAAKKPPTPRVDYSKFSHSTHTVKEKLACNTCHKFPTKNWKDIRKGDEAFPDVAEFPEHASCLNCHRQQFFARETPAPVICSNCHVAVTPRNTVRLLFPSLGEPFLSSKQGQNFVSEFQVAFPHDKHVDVVGFNRRPSPDAPALFIAASYRFRAVSKANEEMPKSCPVCHQTYKPQGNSADEYFTKPPPNLGDDFWLKKGTFKTTPVNHSVCFTCHSDDSGIAPAPADCNACHKLFSQPVTKTDFDPALPARMGITDWFVLRKWPRRDLSATFRHEGGAHPDLSCTNCHNPATMNLLEPKTLRIPVTSCGGADGCHITATTDDGGILNFEVDQRKTKPTFRCTKCHLIYGTEPIPEDHLAAIAALKKK